MDNISVTLTTNYKEKPAGPDIPFGVFTTDHMFLMNYDREQGWHDPRIVPYAPFQMDPACMVLHYAQEIFEGMKAYRDEAGKIRLFRPEENFKRMNDSCALTSASPFLFFLYFA